MPSDADANTSARPTHPPLAQGFAALATRRTGPGFRQLFGASARDVLDAMDAAADDLVSQKPLDGGRIDGVGLVRREVPVIISNPFDPASRVTAMCRVKVDAGVPTTRRGLHLSRIGHVLADSVRQVHQDPTAYAAWVAERVASSQYGTANVYVDASVPYVQEAGSNGRTAVKWSLEHLRLVGRAAVSPERVRRDAGVRISHLVACPCVQQTLKHALRANGTAVPAMHGQVLPLMTHSQRCVTTIVVRNLRRPFSAADALGALDEVLVRTCNTLPRDEELACVFKAHQTPQFIEDGLRAAVRRVAQLWPQDAFDCVDGRARSLESIHEYDLVARMRVTSQSAGECHES